MSTAKELKEVCRLVDTHVRMLVGSRSGLGNSGMLSAAVELNLGNASVQQAAQRIVDNAKSTQLSLDEYIRSAAGVVHRETTLPLTIITLASAYTRTTIRSRLAHDAAQRRAFFSELDAEKLSVDMIEASVLGQEASIDMVLSCVKKGGLSLLPTILLGLRGILDPCLIYDFPFTRTLWKRGDIEVANTTYARTARAYIAWEKNLTSVQQLTVVSWNRSKHDWEQQHAGWNKR